MFGPSLIVTERPVQMLGDRKSYSGINETKRKNVSSKRNTKNKEIMKNLTFFAAALAAGLTNFSAYAKDTSVASLESAVENNKANATGIPDEAARKIDAITTGPIGKAGKSPKVGKIEGAKSDLKYGSIVARYASTYGVPASLAHAVIRVESNYRPNARGRAGEVGLMQIKPATARMMGYSGSTKALFNPETNIKYGMKYLAKARQLGGGTTCGTILKYNAGHGAKRMNPVSSAYCKKVKLHLAGA